MAITISNITCASIPESADYFITVPSGASDTREYMTTLSDNFYRSSETTGVEYDIYENSLIKITAQRSSNYLSYIYIYDKENENQKYIVFANGNYKNTYVAFGYDDSLQKAYIFSVGSFYYNNNWNMANNYELGYSSADKIRLYELISGSQIIIISNWHSLQSLTGNGQTVQLVTLNSNAINDGEPVSNADLSLFSVLPSNQNNVRYLVNLAVAAAASESTNDVTVTYTIPALKKGNYTTVKLYGKIGEYPACDNTDDLIEDLDPTKTTKDILGLTGNSTYYFCIQFITSDGLKLSSNVESIFIGDPVPPEYQEFLDIINKDQNVGNDFFWSNYSVTGASRLSIITNPKNYSWVRPNGNWRGNEVIISDLFKSTSILASTIITINITQVDNHYNFHVSDYEIAIDENRYGYSFQYSYYEGKDGSLVASSDYVNQYVLDNYWRMGIFDYGGFNDVGAALEFLTHNIRNCNIYVDGVLWSKANNTN